MSAATDSFAVAVRRVRVIGQSRADLGHSTLEIVARLGGWNCYYKPPGPKTIRAGWDKLAAMTAGFHIACRLRH
jgi:hypothetical protein